MELTLDTKNIGLEGWLNKFPILNLKPNHSNSFASLLWGNFQVALQSSQVVVSRYLLNVA